MTENGNNIPNNSNKHFRGQTDDENVIIFFRKHWIVLLKYKLIFLLYLFFVIIGIVSLFSFNISIADIKNDAMIKISIFSFIIIGIIVMHYFFNKVLNYYLDIVIITNYRLVEVTKTIYLKNVVSTLELERVQDIKGSKLGVLENLFGYGQLIMTSASINFEKKLDHVPIPHFYADLLNNARHKFKEGD